MHVQYTYVAGPPQGEHSLPASAASGPLL